MDKPAYQPPYKPQFALRVGITGARRLGLAQQNRIEAQLASVLNAVKTEMNILAADSLAHGDFYRHEPDCAPLPQLCMISPLARGADRMAARAACAAGYKLFVPMPFAQHEYERDFTGSEGKLPGEIPLSAAEDLAEFRTLLAAASGSVELDGERRTTPADSDESLAPYSYEAVGRFVVRHCDLLLAIWDGKAGNGRGGTSEIVYYAAQSGVPIWWIHATGEMPPLWVAGVRDLPPHKQTAAHAEAGQETDSETNALRQLDGYLRGLVLQPREMPQDEKSEDKPGWLEHFGEWLSRRRVSLLNEYFSRPQMPFSLLGRAKQIAIEKFEDCFFKNIHKWVMTLAERKFGKNRPTGIDPPDPTDPVPRYWNTLYKAADRFANIYTKGYRSSYVLTILLTALAPILGAGALLLTLMPHGEKSWLPLGALILAFIELFDLVAILLVVAVSLAGQWHRRSIEFRLMAELFRQQKTLAPLGWTLPFDNVQQIGDARHQSWLAWLFAALVRSAPMLEGSFSGNIDQKAACKQTVLDLIDEQCTYHKDRAGRSHNAGKAFADWGQTVFTLVLLLVVFKISFELTEEHLHLMDRIGSLLPGLVDKNLVALAVVVVCALMAVVLPGISAAFVAIRSYAELELLTGQSEHMVAALEHVQTRVERVEINLPLASQDLGAEALGLAAVMLRDLEGWGRLFRGKILEAS